MDDRQVGRIFRAVRRRHGWRQWDVAKAAGVDRAYVSLVECGHLARLALNVTRRIADVLEISLPLAPRWHGPELAKLLDADHAALVERITALLQRHGWEVVVEYTFNHFGERGSVDIAAWHAASRSLLIIEVKTRLVDIQDLLSALGRKVRIVPQLLAQERGWVPLQTGTLLVVPGRSTERRVVTTHAATFRSALPDRAHAARSWITAPVGPLRALWFLSDVKLIHATEARGGPERMRVPRLTMTEADPRSIRGSEPVADPLSSVATPSEHG